MDTIADKTPVEVAATLVLAARFIMEHASARLALPPAPTRSLLVELAALIDDTAKQLDALLIAVHAALRQSEQ